MKNLILSALLISSCCFFACQKDNSQAPAPAQQTETQQYFAPLDLEGLSSRSSCPWEVIPAGSVDVLQQAIDNICEGGIIYLKAGLHTENEPISVNKSVKIIGEDGAVLKIESAAPSPWDADFLLAVHPAIHVVGAPGTLIQNVEIEPLNPDGNTAILVENSNYSAVMRCKISDFQIGVLVEKSNQMTIMLNTIAASGAWLTGEVEEAYGIFVLNGKSVYVSDNELSNAFCGAWATDEWGTFERNHLHGNYIGLLLCNAPEYVILPSGDLAGSANPGTGWKVRNNKAEYNFDAGFLVIDGAKSNFLQNNEGGNNGTYDIELAGESERFGYTTPTSVGNKVMIGSFHNNTVKDCGQDNEVLGQGIIVDTSVDACY